MQWRSEPGYDRLTTVQGQRAQNQICSNSTYTSAARILPSTVTCAYATGTAVLQHHLNSCTAQSQAVIRASGRHFSTDISGIARQRVGRCRFSIPGWTTQLLSFPKRPHRPWGPHRRFFPRGLSGQGVRLTTHLHIVPKLRMCGATPHLPIYTFMAWTQTTLCSWWSSDISEMLPRHNAARAAYTIQSVNKSTQFLHAHSHTFVRTATTESLPFANWKFKNGNIHKYTFVLFLVHHI